MLKLGLIGCGNVVQKSHIHAYKSLQELISVEIVSDIDLEKAKIVAQKLSAESTINYKELFKRNLDCIVVSVPIGISSQINLEVLEHKIPLITEKPGASNYEEALQLVTFSRENNVPFSFVQNYIYGTKYLQALEMLDKIGTVFYTRLENPNAGYGSKSSTFDMSWRLSPNLAGHRGCLLNHGFHEIYLALHFNKSPVKSIFATARNFNYEPPLEDIALAILEHENGSISQITVGFLHKLITTSVEEVHGTNGSINIHNMKVAEKTKKEYSHTRFFRERFTELTTQGKFHNNLDEFLTIHSIIDACYKSIDSGQKVFL